MKAKKIFLVMILLSVCLVTELTSCKKENLTVRSDSDSSDATHPTATAGGWTNGVSYFTEVDTMK